MTQTPGNLPPIEPLQPKSANLIEPLQPKAVPPAAPPNMPAGPSGAAPAATPAAPTKAQQKIQNFNANGPIPPPLKPRKPFANTKDATDEDLGPEGDKLISDKPVSDTVGAANKWFSKISVSGWLGISFFVLVFLIWMVIPTASGYTRMQLLWFTLLGETKLTTDNQPDQNSPGWSGDHLNPESTPFPTPTTPTSTPSFPGLAGPSPEQLIQPIQNGNMSSHINFAALDAYDF